MYFATMNRVVVTEYFAVRDQYLAKYGPRTVLLFEIGSFYEIYDKPNEIDVICNILNIQRTRRVFNQTFIDDRCFLLVIVEKFLQSNLSAWYVINVAIDSLNQGAYPLMQILDVNNLKHIITVEVK